MLKRVLPSASCRSGSGASIATSSGVVTNPMAIARPDSMRAVTHSGVSCSRRIRNTLDAARTANPNTTSTRSGTRPEIFCPT